MDLLRFRHSNLCHVICLLLQGLTVNSVTGAHVTVQQHGVAVLPCNHTKAPDTILIVQWTKVAPDASPGPLTSYFRGEWTMTDKYNMEETFSFVIRDVVIRDQGVYECLVSTSDASLDYTERVELNVSVPIPQYPTIRNCGVETSPDTPCTLQGFIGHTLVLTCELSGIYPAVTPTWKPSGSRDPDPLIRVWSEKVDENIDGTFNTSIAVNITLVGSSTDLVCSFTSTGGTRSSVVHIVASVVNPGTIHTSPITGMTTHGVSKKKPTLWPLIFLPLILLIAGGITYFYINKYKNRREQADTRTEAHLPGDPGSEEQETMCRTPADGGDTGTADMESSRDVTDGVLLKESACAVEALPSSQSSTSKGENEWEMVEKAKGNDEYSPPPQPGLLGLVPRLW